jgi:hypothetical protein
VQAAFWRGWGWGEGGGGNGGWGGGGEGVFIIYEKEKTLLENKCSAVNFITCNSEQQLERTTTTKRQKKFTKISK